MTTLTDRFDPIPNEPYGHGQDGEIFATEAEAKEYMTRTFEEAKAQGGSRGKSVRVTNASREERIRNFTHTKVDDALEDAMSKLARAVENGDATAEEIRSALWSAGQNLEEMFDDWMEDL